MRVYVCIYVKYIYEIICACDMSFFEGLAKEEFYLVFLCGDEYTSAIFSSSFSLLLSFLTKRSDFTKKKDGKYTTTYSFSNNNNKKKIYARSRYQKRL